MGGVGKTTLLNRINNEFLKSRVGFDAVIWVTVSRPANVEKVQQVLFNKLEIPSNNWEGRSEDERKEAIFNVLKMKKIVALLDDIWEPLDLFAVGIPPVNDGNKSKVVFTTRFSTVCRDMGAKGIEVKCLAWEEAFALFQAYVGEDTIYSHPHIPKLAETAAKECDGLPLALITIGRAMAGTKTPEEWEKKIQMLKNYPAKFPGMENHLFPRLAFSYDSLQDETIKSCFLYCSLFLEDYNINCDELIQLWIGEGFLDEYGDIKEARNGGEDIIASLNHACLLEITVTDNIWTQARCRCVKMHDVIRDMALLLACQNGNKKQNKFVVVDKGELVNAQEVEKWKGTQRLSLVSASFEELIMEPPSFSNLQTLLVFVNWTLPLSFPSGFFSYMPIITVLDFSDHDNLIDLPIEIGKLFTLQYLNLSGTRIRTLPMELRNFKKLRCLLLDDLFEFEIPSQIISGLSSLQLFSVMDSDEATRGDCRAILDELEGLKCMGEVSISLDSVLAIQTLLNSHKLQRCLKRLDVHNCWDMDLLQLFFPYLEVFEVRNCSNLEDVTFNLEKEVHSTFPRHQYLYHLAHVRIVSCENLMKLTCLIYAPNLKSLFIENCDSLEEVIEVDESGVSEIESDLGLFSRLTHLHLRILQKLRSICGWSLLFPSLKVIHVVRCPNLRKLPFDSNIGISKNLEEIEGEGEWWDELEWEDQTIMHNLGPYFKPL
ncbi:unnamed protein product, partial [Vitis vinifera]